MAINCKVVIRYFGIFKCHYQGEWNWQTTLMHQLILTRQKSIKMRMETIVFIINTAKVTKANQDRRNIWNERDWYRKIIWNLRTGYNAKKFLYLLKTSFRRISIWLTYKRTLCHEIEQQRRLYGNTISTIAWKIDLCQNTFFDYSGDGSAGSDDIETGLKIDV